MDQFCWKTILMSAGILPDVTLDTYWLNGNIRRVTRAGEDITSAFSKSALKFASEWYRAHYSEQLSGIDPTKQKCLRTVFMAGIPVLDKNSLLDKRDIRKERKIIDIALRGRLQAV